MLPAKNVMVLLPKLSGIFVYWFTETVAFQCELTTVRVPLVKLPWNYLEMLALYGVCVVKDRMGLVYSP